MMLFFFFQAEDGIRVADVTGVQTCALPICDAALFLLPSLSPTTVAPKPDATATLRTVAETIDRLQKLPDASAAAKRLAAVLQETASHGADGVATMERVLLAGLPQQLDSLRLA